MLDMKTNHARWRKRQAPSQAELAVRQAGEEPPVHLDVERLRTSIESPRFVMPSGLTPEEKRQFMLAVAAGHR